MDKLNKNILFCALLITIILGSANFSFASISVENSSKYIGDGRWSWEIFINADRGTLNRIQCVEYTLHPTFPNPVNRVCNRQTAFSLKARGWGTFVVKVRVYYTDRQIQDFDHQLVFKERAAAPSIQLSPQNWSREIEPGWWEWGISLKGESLLLDEIRCVEYTLHRSFRNNVRTRCTRNNNFELRAKGWGTFTIPVKVLLKDGSILLLSHQLQFNN